MSINDIIEQGAIIQGERRVTALDEYSPNGVEVVLYEGDDEWGYMTLEEEWADWDINYMYPNAHCAIEIELDNPNA